ncbi:uncharacterized protein LOC129591162 [Paramacrobiotus metropolitanus]|uniref:uncharacterized protein LOC129591162 n=1 Tax=Paramacrobiotus metropolitanus TaxID=2943436 RepID=UPI002445CD73|nr:uncharacterized protein LOC129591162 [Paramacrobiotus metropolitanus]
MHIIWLAGIAVMIIGSVDSRPNSIPSNPLLTPANRFKRQWGFVPPEAFATINRWVTQSTTEPPRPTCPMFVPMPGYMSFTSSKVEWRCCVIDDSKHPISTAVWCE